MAFVVTKLTLSESGDIGTEGLYVYVKGREAGLLSWILSIFGIDPTITLSASKKTILFEKGSLTGFEKRVIPVKNICSTYYGYTKPWQVFIAGFILFVPTFSLSLVFALFYYFLNKTISLGFVENSGVVNSIQFKRSLIEGQGISEKDARKVVDIIQSLIDNSSTDISSVETIDSLTGLNQLYNQGIITAEEFEQKRKKLLRSI